MLIGNGYVIRSLYFDSLYNRDFYEKESGVEKRRKIRLRIYDTNQDFAMLEMKQKDGKNQLKRSLIVSKKDAEQLILGNYSVLLNYKEDFATECYSVMNMYLYRPKSIVQYFRKAYVIPENNIRITFDFDVKATESNFDIFSNDLVLNKVLDDTKVILEVKYNNFLLDYIKDVLEMVNKSEISVSKYCLSRN